MATGTTNQASGSGKSETQGNGSGHKKGPVWTKKGFPLQIAVFEFPTDKGPPNFSVKLTRTFRRDDESEWETTEYLGGGDCLRASKLYEYADAFIQSRLEADYSSKKDSGKDF